MKRSSFLRRLIGLGIAATPVAKVISQIVPEGKKIIAAPISENSIQAIKQTKPIIIKIKNTSLFAKRNIEVFAPARNLPGDLWNDNGDHVFNQIKIESGVDGKSYRQIMYEILINPFTVGNTAFVFGEYLKREKIATVVSIDPNGNKAIMPICNYPCPYGQKNNVVTLEVNYRMDCITGLVIHEIAPGEEVKVFLYPQTKIQPFNPSTKFVGVRNNNKK